MSRKRDALLVLAFMCHRSYKAYFDPTISLSQHLHLVAELMFMTFAVVRHEALRGALTTVIPSQLLHDDITTGLASFWMIAKMKVHDTLLEYQIKFYPFLVGGDPIETFHGMHGPDGSSQQKPAHPRS